MYERPSWRDIRYVEYEHYPLLMQRTRRYGVTREDMEVGDARKRDGLRLLPAPAEPQEGVLGVARATRVVDTTHFLLLLLVG
jgi:hypothetical protein